MADKDPKADQPSPDRAERLREHIREITGHGGKKGGAPDADEKFVQPKKSLNEIVEERMRDHVGEKKP